MYGLAAVVAVTGLSYAAVPLYKAFCQATGYGGTTQRATEEKFKGMKPVEGARSITVMFNADTGASMPWVFKPQQRSVKVVPGETALAFYTAYNPTDKPITGVSTYNITPMRAGLYFNKIQCFCFEEQRLRPREEIDMPVFFYIDPSFLQDPAMDGVKSLTLSYTFFRTGEQEVLDASDEIRKQEVGKGSGIAGSGVASSVALSAGAAAEAADANTSERVKAWTREVAAKAGLADKLKQQTQQQ
jgi:cytochrome c oxidase assembly protein subunit 11